MNKNALLIELSESDKTKFGKEDFATQSVPQRVFSSIWSVESEVNNGGFAEYFRNSGTETAPFVVEALEIIGASRAAQICKRAIAAAFPDGLPALSAIHSVIDGLPDDTLENLGSLDEEFFSYPDNLTDLLFAYVSKHPEEFGELPSPDA